MSFNLNTTLTKIESLLDRNNTTTSGFDISSGLNTRVKRFYKGVEALHDNIPVPKTVYPVVFIEAMNKTEDFSGLGNNTRRDISLQVAIVPVTDHGAGTALESEGRENADTEIITLSQNIEYLLRNKINLSQTVSWVSLSDTDYSIVRGEKTWNSVSRILLDIHIENSK